MAASAARTPGRLKGRRLVSLRRGLVQQQPRFRRLLLADGQSLQLRRDGCRVRLFPLQRKCLRRRLVERRRFGRCGVRKRKAAVGADGDARLVEGLAAAADLAERRRMLMFLAQRGPAAAAFVGACFVLFPAGRAGDHGRSFYQNCSLNRSLVQCVERVAAVCDPQYDPLASCRPPMIRLNDILEKVSAYHKDADLDLIKKAYVYSAKVHQGQVRKSGEPYLVHPLEVAGILADLKLDEASIVAGLLHDTVEDTLAKPDEIKEIFGNEVAELVDGVTKLGKMQSSKNASFEEKQAENFRKMLVAMAKDIRVILVKLADRIHNMRTLEHMKPEKPAAHRAGDAGHLRAARQPARHPVDQDRARGPGLQVPEARRTSPTLEKQGREDAEGPREVHRRRRRDLEDQAARARPQARSAGPAQALLLHLQEDAQERARLGRRRSTTSSPSG